MSDTIQPGNTAGHGGFERRDIGVKGVVYFFAGLVVATGLVVLFLDGMFYVLDKREGARQPAVNALVTNAPVDTRKLPEGYEDYLKKNFPAPQLEINERNQLDKVRIGEEETLGSYGWVDEKAGTVRIPIERAMELVAQRGLPVRAQSAAAPEVSAAVQKEKKK